MDDLLIEIYTEEIPAAYIIPALNSFRNNFSKRLASDRIPHGNLQVFGTPRRLALLIHDVASRQDNLIETVMGPPEKIAYDSDGKITTAGRKFAEKMEVPVSKVMRKQTEKGSYTCVYRDEPGVPTVTILKNLIPETILTISFPKSMRWADLSISFARPIKTIVALLGNKIIPFTIDHRIKSGRSTFGHMFMSPGKVKIPNAKEYIERLRNADVLVDIGERRSRILDQVKRNAKELGGIVLSDPELVDIVTNLVEYPIAVSGQFDREYLSLPREILITAMREHQKYFAVTDSLDNLIPCFVAVNNTRPRDEKIVAEGHQRVLRARLSDARFFYLSDLDKTMPHWVESLKKVMFQAKLGTIYDKVIRVMDNAESLAYQYNPKLKSSASRAAYLSKADLVSQVVIEFPKLQGIMGRIYALNAGEPEDVANAIEEHYQPTHAGGKLPATETGAIVAIADKIDSICGCFCIGLIPSGASDPYALRRQGIGIVRILLDRDISFSLNKLILIGLGQFSKKAEIDINYTFERVFLFLKSRISHILEEQGYPKDIIAAVMSVSVENIPDVWRRVQVLRNLRDLPEYEPLVATFKRVANIIKQADPNLKDQVDKLLFEDGCESVLYKSLVVIRQKVKDKLKEGMHQEALLDMASLRTDVDTFFERVKIMAENEEVRNNRLSLLKEIESLFGKIADFSQLSL